MKKIPLGPCYIQFNDVVLGETLKTEETNLKIQTKTEEIKTDESSEIKEEIEVSREIIFETTMLMSSETLTLLGINNFSSLLKKGKLIIKTLDDSVMVTFFEAILNIQPIFNFKTDKVSTLKLRAKALRDINKKDIEITLN